MNIARLSQALLTTADFPSGMAGIQTGGAPELTNCEGTAVALPDAIRTQAGVTLAYTSQGEPTGTWVSQGIYGADQGKGPQAFDGLLSLYKPCQATPAGGAARYDAVPFEMLGDQTLAFAGTGSDPFLGDYVEEVVVFRRGDIVELMAVFSAVPPGDTATLPNLAQYWAERADAKLKAAMQ